MLAMPIFINHKKCLIFSSHFLIITLLPFFIEILEYDWLWSGHMIIKEMFYIPILKPEFARASMTTSDAEEYAFFKKKSTWNVHTVRCQTCLSIKSTLVPYNDFFLQNALHIWYTGQFWENIFFKFNIFLQSNVQHG